MAKSTQVRTLICPKRAHWLEVFISYINVSNNKRIMLFVSHLCALLMFLNVEPVSMVTKGPQKSEENDGLNNTALN